MSQKPNLYEMFHLDDPTLKTQVALLDLAKVIRQGLAHQATGFAIELNAEAAKELADVIEKQFSTDTSR